MLEHLRDFEKRLRHWLQATSHDGRSRLRPPGGPARIERIDRLRRRASS
jgi:hypothetical protein